MSSLIEDGEETGIMVNPTKIR